MDSLKTNTWSGSVTPELEKAFDDVANQVVQPDEVRPGEWKCRLCGGESVADGPVVHFAECQLSVLHEALETGGQK
jgi:hypothetical protein